MGLIDDVLKGDLFTHYADQLSDEERALVEENVRKMLSTAEAVHSNLRSLMADEQGRNAISDTLEYLISEEGLKTWQQDKS